jgi:hypothetical protein
MSLANGLVVNTIDYHSQNPIYKVIHFQNLRNKCKVNVIAALGTTRLCLPSLVPSTTRPCPVIFGALTKILDHRYTTKPFPLPCLVFRNATLGHDLLYASDSVLCHTASCCVYFSPKL